jgi:drug/metabolite transporter (DMT)-like permease
MSIVAPISATGAAVPVIVGVATGDRPAVLQVVGIAAATAGIVLASREASPDEDRATANRLSIGLALFAALGFGAFFVGMKAGADASVLWALLVARASSVIVLCAYAAAARPRLLNARTDLPPLILIGALDLSANALYALASTEGLLSVVGVLGSLYPVTTVLLRAWCSVSASAGCRRSAWRPRWVASS